MSCASSPKPDSRIPGCPNKGVRTQQNASPVTAAFTAGNTSSCIYLSVLPKVKAKLPEGMSIYGVGGADLGFAGIKLSFLILVAIRI